MWSFDLISQTMPVINVDDLTDLDKAKMEVTQLKTEVKLERAQVSIEIYSWPEYTKWTTSKLDGHCWYAHFCLIVTFMIFFPSGVQMLWRDFRVHSEWSRWGSFGQRHSRGEEPIQGERWMCHLLMWTEKPPTLVFIAAHGHLLKFNHSWNPLCYLKKDNHKHG